MSLITAISPDDDMYRGSSEDYFASGQSAIDCIRQVKGDVRTILDLPCGYGRIMRALKAEFPQASITACDVNRQAVDFCAETFLAHPVYSDPDPKKIPFEETVDLIWCGSLFTHLDEDRFIGFLEFFRDHLNPEGVLCFTTNGRWAGDLLRRGGERAGRYFPPLDTPAEKLLEDYKRQGFAYSEYEQIAHFEHVESFGATLSTPQWVDERLREAGLQCSCFIETGYDETQDFVAAGSLVTCA